ncbi:MAG: FAD-dependent oxidoreductase, partial [Candidatus Freyarchaeota archaeon]
MRVDAVIIGGGVTGLGIARDLAQRGLRVALFERRDIASGTTGRSHGLLHSGARYVVRDPVSASECAKENRVLRRIAPHVIEETGGMFVAVEEDDLDYERKFLEGCKRASVRVEELSVRESRKIEPYLNPSAYTVFLVDDAVVDPFRLAIANFLAAKEHNAEIYTYEPVRLIVHEGTVVGVETVNTKQKIYSDVVINATGPWADFICRQAGLEIGVKPNKGTLVVTGKRVVNTVLNRLRPPSDGDIIVPHQTTMILGTTSTYIKDPDEVMPTIEEVNLIL